MLRHFVYAMGNWRDGFSDNETALVILLPSVDEELQGIKQIVGVNSMSAHITVLYPFARLSSVTGGFMSRLRCIIGEIDPFEFELSTIGWFGERVLYLVPTPPEPFQRMTQLLSDNFPDHLPYRGEFEEIVPHLTISEHATLSRLRDAARTASGLLPIYAEVNNVCLMAQDGSGAWRIHTVFDLRH